MAPATGYRILFIGGYGRSGSTLLERLLGQIEGVFTIGEACHMWERSFAGNQLCSCGDPFDTCDVWADIRRRFLAEEGRDPASIRALANRVHRIRHIPQLAAPRLRSRAYRSAHARYATIVRSLYQAIADRTGASVIVDSSKDANWGYLLRSVFGPDMTVVHLVRDSRAVAYSWTRQRVRPEIRASVEYMPRYPVSKSAVQWFYKNLLTEGLGRRNPYLRLRYETMIAHPRAVVARVAAAAGIEAADLSYIDGNTARLGVGHSVSGNPTRFETGPVSLRPDEKWRSDMSPRESRIVTALTSPLLLRYGYTLS